MNYKNAFTLTGLIIGLQAVLSFLLYAISALLFKFGYPNASLAIAQSALTISGLIAAFNIGQVFTLKTRELINSELRARTSGLFVLTQLVLSALALWVGYKTLQGHLPEQITAAALLPFFLTMIVLGFFIYLLLGQGSSIQYKLLQQQNRVLEVKEPQE